MTVQTLSTVCRYSTSCRTGKFSISRVARLGPSQRAWAKLRQIASDQRLDFKAVPVWSIQTVNIFTKHYGDNEWLRQEEALPEQKSDL